MYCFNTCNFFFLIKAERPLPYPNHPQVQNVSDSQSMTHCYFTDLYKPSLSLTNNSGMMAQEGETKSYAQILPKQHLKVMCPFLLDYLLQSFWSLQGKSVPLSHGISFIFDLAWVYPEVRRRWPDEINGQIGFLPWSPWKKTIKQQRDLESSRSLLWVSSWLCFCSRSSCNKSVK